MRRLLGRLTFIGLLISVVVPAFGQLGGPAHIAFQATLVPPDARAGEGAEIVLTAKIDPGYHLYSLTQPEGGPVRTTITVPAGGPFAFVGKAVQPPYRSVFDPGFHMNDQEYEGAVAFGIPVKLRSGIAGAQKAVVTVHYQLCTDRNCLIPTTVSVPLHFNVAAGPPRPDHLQPITAVPPQPAGAAIGTSSSANTTGQAATSQPISDSTRRSIALAEHRGLLSFLLLSIGAGFLALLTPCVFPMVPITVSFFSKRRQRNAREGIRDALAYCFGIVATFTLLGIAAAVLFKATGIRAIANNPFVNLALAVLFIVLGINLMGGFEIALPAGLANRFAVGTQKTGVLGPFFMGLTFTLTTFTCTVAFVGTLLAAAAEGDLFYPIIGMLGFSVAFALPFFLLALFPQYVARLPHSGSWLTTVKAYLGFVELAAAVKFLSNADLVWSLGWLTRPVFLAIWAAIALIAGCYLMGWLLLPHDTTATVGKVRRGFGLLTLVACVYLYAGINHAPLGTLAAFLPPDPYPGQAETASGGLTWLHSYAEALALAKQENRPVFINFTGVNCTNCRDMEQNVFPRPEVAAELKKFVLVELYTDRDRPEDHQNAQLLQKLAGVATLPTYVVISPDGRVRAVLQDRRPPQVFLRFLEAHDS
jgi:thiol:disulfide interchange protein